MSPKSLGTREQILQALQEHGPMNYAQMMEHIQGPGQHTVETKCLEMLKIGELARDEISKVYSINENKPSPDGKGTVGAPLNPEPQFSELLLGVGVDRVYVPTITKLFVDGDTKDLKWLREVLTKHAAGFIKKHQVSLILASWSKSLGLPYNPDDFPIEGEGEGEKDKKPPKSMAATIAEEAGIGFQIGKDKEGDWVVKPGGPLTYEAALTAAQRSNYIKAVERSQSGSGDGSEEPAEEADGKPTAKGGRAARSFNELFMAKALDVMFDSKKSAGDSEVVQALQGQITALQNTIGDLKDNEQRERLDRIEANLASIASRDPWDDPRGIEMRQRLNTPNVTDSSPAVQLIKDSTDKMDKNVARLVSIVEKAALQTDAFRPEESRTPAEKEAKAGALLSEAQNRERSKELRKRAFG